MCPNDDLSGGLAAHAGTRTAISATAFRSLLTGRLIVSATARCVSERAALLDGVDLLLDDGRTLTVGVQTVTPPQEPARPCRVDWDRDEHARDVGHAGLRCYAADKRAVAAVSMFADLRIRYVEISGEQRLGVAHHIAFTPEAGDITLLQLLVDPLPLPDATPDRPQPGLAFGTSGDVPAGVIAAIDVFDEDADDLISPGPGHPPWGVRQLPAGRAGCAASGG